MTDTATAHREIGGKAVTIRRVAGRAYFRVGALFLHTFGRTLGGLLSGAGLRLADDTVLHWRDLIGLVLLARSGQGPLATDKGRDSAAQLVGALLARFETVDPDRLETLAEAMIVGHVTIAGAEVTRIELVDALLTEPTAYMELVVAAFQVNMGPIFAAGSTNVGSAAAATSEPPAAMRSARAR
jgi:hypothetical protein